jgi:hypothetical protein
MDGGRFFSWAAGFAAALAFLFPTTLPAASNPEEEADQKLLQAAKVGTDGPALLEFFRKQTVAKIDQGRIAQLVRRLGDKNYRVRRNATAGLKAIGVPALPALRATLKARDIEVRLRAGQCVRAIEGTLRPELTAAAARLITVRRPPKACAVLLAYLPFSPQDFAEDEVVIALLQLGVNAGKVNPEVAAALDDPAPARRAAAALVLGRSGTAEQRAAVRKLLSERDPKIRFRAAQGLLAARDKAAIPVLVTLLAEGPLQLAQRAEEALMCLAADKPPNLALGEEVVERKKCRECWAAWWKANGENLDLKGVEADLLLKNPILRARLATRQFFDACRKGDLAGLKKVTNAPFFHSGETKTQEHLDRWLAELVEIISTVKTKGKRLKFTLSHVVSVNEYTRGKPRKKGLMDKLRKLGVRIVYVNYQLDGDFENIAIFVRITGNRPGIIGVGDGVQGK